MPSVGSCVLVVVAADVDFAALLLVNQNGPYVSFMSAD